MEFSTVTVLKTVFCRLRKTSGGAFTTEKTFFFLINFPKFWSEFYASMPHRMRREGGEVRLTTK